MRNWWFQWSHMRSANWVGSPEFRNSSFNIAPCPDTLIVEHLSLEVFWWNLNIENYNSNRTASVEHFDEVGDEEFYFIVHLAVFHKVFSSGEYGTQNCSGIELSQDLWYLKPTLLKFPLICIDLFMCMKKETLLIHLLSVVIKNTWPASYCNNHGLDYLRWRIFLTQLLFFWRC